MRAGDWFGATVNVAARVSSIAEAGLVLVTEGTQTAAGRLCGVDLHPLGEHRLRNVRYPVRVYAAHSTHDEASPLPIDRSAKWPSTRMGPPDVSSTARGLLLLLPRVHERFPPGA